MKNHEKSRKSRERDALSGALRDRGGAVSFFRSPFGRSWTEKSFIFYSVRARRFPRVQPWQSDATLVFGHESILDYLYLTRIGSVFIHSSVQYCSHLHSLKVTS